MVGFLLLWLTGGIRARDISSLDTFFDIPLKARHMINISGLFSQEENDCEFEMHVCRSVLAYKSKTDMDQNTPE